MKLKSIIPFFAIFFIIQIAVFAQTNEVLINQAKDAIEKNDYASAMSSLDIVLKRLPNDEAALTQRARTYIRQSKFAEAMADLSKVLARNPKNYEALNARGVVKRERDKDLNGALDDFTQAVTIKPDFYIGYINLGVTNRGLKRANQANEAFSKAIEIAPNNPIGFAYRGSNWSALSRYKAAILDFDKAISLNDKNESYYANRGYCHFRMFVAGSGKKSFDLAKSDVEKSISLNPNNSQAFGIRSVIRFEENNLAGATADADKSLQLNPNSYLSFITKGFIKYSSDREGALEEIDRAYKIVPNDTWVRDKRFEVARNLTTPLAKQIQEESKKVEEAKQTKALASLEVAKQVVAANPWDFNSFVDLNDAFDKADVKRDEFYEKLISENRNNICAILFLGKIRYLKPHESIAAYKDLLSRYDGKNGKRCAANIASEIAIVAASSGDLENAKIYLGKAKAINSELGVVDPNVNDAEEYVERNKAEDERLTKRLAELDKTKNPTRVSDKEAFSDKEFDEASAALERDNAANNKHIAKYNEYATFNQKNTSYTANYPLMLKEAEEIIANKERFLNKYSGLLNASGNMSLVFEIRLEIKEWKVRAEEMKKRMK